MEPDFITDDLNALIRLRWIYISHCSDIFLCGFNHVMIPDFFLLKEMSETRTSDALVPMQELHQETVSSPSW